jgi:hypothetical protein
MPHQYRQDEFGHPMPSARTIVLSDASATPKVNVKAGLAITTAAIALKAPNNALTLRIYSDTDLHVGLMANLADAVPVSNGWMTFPVEDGTTYYIAAQSGSGSYWFYFEVL